jgi:threonine/homoserine/homoserine lactone efflux protein
VVSLLGTLPLSVLNVMAMQMAAQKGVPAAMQFSVGIVLVEMLYILVCLKIAAVALTNTKVKNILYICAQIFFIALCIYYLIQFINYKPSGPADFKMPIAIPFLCGLFLSVINPLQIPFWLGWIIQFAESGILKIDGKLNWRFALGAGCGTLAGLSIFVSVGIALQQWLIALDRYLMLAMCLLFLWACINAYRNRKR